MFQDCYKSEAVKDDVCFVAVLRYVLNNLSERPGEFIPALRAAGLSIRQINRLTGISFGIVRKY